MNTALMTGPDLQAAVAGEYLDLAECLEAAPANCWDAPSLCAGWRTREVIAHLTMPLRYDGQRFMEELTRANGDFNLMADRCARQDAMTLTPRDLITALRDPRLHAWQPPGGGHEGALCHVVVHGLDVTVPLGLVRSVPEGRIRRVLELAAGLQSLRSNVTDCQLRATDLDWSFGTGEPALGSAQDLALALFGRHLPHGHLAGAAAHRFTA